VFIYQVFASTAAGELVQGLLLAESRERAWTLAIERTKSQFGIGSRVRFVAPIINAGEIARLKHTGLTALLQEFDQIRFVCWTLHTQTQELAKLVGELIDVVREAQISESAQDGGETNV
jgi:hypothetical protein